MTSGWLFLLVVLFGLPLVAEDTITAELTYVAVSKDSLKAELRTLPENPSDVRVIKTFPIALGKEIGDKEKEGDNKTPEGIYLTLPKLTIQNKKLKAEKYGAYAIPLDYPNPIDRIHKKTGSGIWLHGAGQDSRLEKANVTQGCVAFYNADIEYLIDWIKSTSSLVIIAPSIDQINTPSEWNTLYQRTQQWFNTWSSRSFDEYLKFYSQDFTFKKMNLKQFAEYKRAVFKKYKNMSVTMENIRVLVHPKYAVSIMIQNFKGDNSFVTRGRKILYWSKNTSGEWQIAFERFEPSVFEKLKFPVELKTVKATSAL